jgi:ubiquinol-cytochrome c reductase cytochrome c subunit
MKRVRITVILALPAILAACTHFTGQSAPYRPRGQLTAPQLGPTNGFVLYQRDCAWCHGNEGQGTANGPTLLAGTAGPALTDFMLSTGRMPIDFPGQKNATRRETPYTPAEIAGIVDYVRSLRPPGPDVPVVDLSRGNLAQGRELFQENCAACHSTTGTGGALATGKAAAVNGFRQPGSIGLIAPSLLQASPTQVVEAMRTGPPGMPVFGPDAFPDQQADSIALFVDELQRSGSRGGATLGGIGPVAEGAVGWIVGLGILLLFVRWIGTSMRQASHPQKHLEENH